MEDLSKGFAGADYAIFSLLLIISLLVGIFSGRKGLKSGSTTQDFLIGGRTMNPGAVSMSLVGGVISAISVLGNSTEMYLYGTQLWMNLLGCIWGTFIVIFMLLPVLYPLNLVSLYEYLDLRFSSKLLRRLGSLVQSINGALYLGICLYAPSLTLTSVTRMPFWAAVTSLGILCSIYITMGGVRAVVYTDVVQTTVMFFGVLAVVIQVTWDIGGLGNVWSIAEKGGRIEFFNMDTSVLVRHTFWSVQVLGMYFVVSAVGIAQPQFQRLVSVRSLRQSQGVMWAFLFGLIVLWCLFYFSGIVAYAAYADCDPLENGQIEKADQILVYMVADKLSYLPGMAGLFVAAIAGAVLSSMSSQAAALAAMIWEDFIKDFWIFKDLSTQKACNVTRILTCLSGLLAIGMAFLIAQMGTLFQAAYSISGAVVSPLDGLYVTAIAAPWVNKWGALSGFSSAFIFNMWLVISKFWYHGGNSTPLPMSTDGCIAPNTTAAISLLQDYNNTLADTTEYFTESFIDITTLEPTNEVITFDMDANERHYPIIFDVSYCYLGSIGIIIVFIVSTIVSCLTGVIPPHRADPRLVDKRCLAVYSWIWQKCGGLEKDAVSKELEDVNTAGDSQNYGSNTTGIDNKALDLNESKTVI